MSFQWIIDRAETISINTKKIVASTQARDGTTRAVSRGGQVWTFDVKLPDGIPWTELRQYITQAETLDRTTASTIQFSNTGHSWIVGYQGSSTNITGLGGAIAIGNITQGSNQITLTSFSTMPVGATYRFRAGDYIQLGSGKCYRVAADVASGGTTVTLHRPVLDSTATGVYIKVAQHCQWSVICTNFPDWTLMARDQVSWSGSFTFVENLV